ncbi:hypothetical protein KIW84_075995 [Lathyrus oleraceus]|uniref:DUF7745 domain-containing protein n=1 Tax=Pisum sativum TaxID=3888 RepID=A0A9D4VVB0_PEA|nr:hypothetical protein KIW84_075995 [Pisum sativum]
MSSDKKNTLPLKFKLQRIDNLLALRKNITHCKKNSFVSKYGQILDLLTTNGYISTLVALAQYYNSPLLCFTFKYFQLAPTIKEYERSLGWYLKDHPSFTILGKEFVPEAVAKALHMTVLEVTFGLGPIRVKEVKLPYSAEVPVPPPEPKSIHTSKGEVDVFRSTIAQLTRENK